MTENTRFSDCTNVQNTIFLFVISNKTPFIIAEKPHSRILFAYLPVK